LHVAYNSSSEYEEYIYFPFFVLPY